MLVFDNHFTLILIQTDFLFSDKPCFWVIFEYTGKNLMQLCCQEVQCIPFY